MLCFLFFLSFQFLETFDTTLVTNANEDWQLQTTVKGVHFFAKEVSCIDSTNGVFIRQKLFSIENNNKVAVKVNWALETKNENGIVELNDLDENNARQVLLNPGERVHGTCNHVLLSTYLHFIDKPEVRKIASATCVDIKVVMLD